MKKHILLLVALSILAQMIWAANVTAPANIPTYYANANGKSGKSLYEALNTITNVGFKSLGYDGAITAYQQSDVYPSDPNHPDYVAGKAGKLWDMYGGCSFTSGDECGNYSGECDCYNREHSVPKSWWGGGKNDMYSDIFHLVPTDGYVNNRRSNYAFGVVSGKPEYQYNGCKLGSPAEVSTDKQTILGTSATCSNVDKVFEPRDEYKGDFARGYLGMIAKYSNTSYSITSGAGGQIFEAFKSTTHFGLTKYGMVLLMKWHREDPVSQKEIDRNNGIQKTQGNRNPFIDYPYLAEYIWGEKAGETVDLSKLMPSTDADFIPGQSNGWRGGNTPPTPVVKYGVTWSVNGEELQTDSIAKDQNVSALPATPQSCSSESTLFMGWTDAPIDGALSDAPSPLYTAAEQIPAITADITLYAVFAQLSSSDVSLPTSYTYAVGNTDDSWTNTATLTNNSYWLLETGKTITSPAIDLMGLEKITVKIRTYGGTSNNKLDISTTDGALTSITTDKGTTLTEFTWTNNLYIAGISPLTFSSNYGSGKGIGISSITIDASGTGATYSRYITNCQSGSEVVNILTDAPAKKVLIGNQIYIFVGEQLFTIQGLQVK